MCNKLHLKLGMVIFIGGLLLLGTAPLWTQAAPPPLPTRPIPTNTPTPMPTATPPPTITVTPPPTTTVTPPPEAAQNSLIVLEARSTAPLEWNTLWTVVEWQETNGAWQPVEGWQGPFDEVDAAGSHKTWSIPPSLFGQGPFRWRVDTAKNSLVLATSQPFTLPNRAGVRLLVAVTLPAAPAQPILLPMTGAPVGWLGAALLLTSLPFLWRLRAHVKRR